MAIRVEGVEPVVEALEGVADAVPDALDTIAAEVADTLRDYAPVGSRRPQRGRVHLVDTIRVANAEGIAAATFGGARAPHAWAVRATHPSRFVERTDRHMADRAAALLEQAIDDTNDRNGLT